MWETWIHNTRTGARELKLEAASASWDSRLTGLGTGTHTFMASTLSAATWDEITTGNRYTLAQSYGNQCVYAGVIQKRRAQQDRTITVMSKELRGALLSARSHFGVNQYNAASGVLTVTNRSFSGAARGVIAAMTAPSAEWALPVDLPSDGSGSVSRTWRHEEVFDIDAMLTEIEDRGCEIDFRPHLSSGVLRWATRVGAPISTGTVFDVASAGPGGRVVGLDVEDDWSDAATGVLGFGSGRGQDRIFAYAPSSGSGAVNDPVSDRFVTFSDVSSQSALQSAVDAEYAALSEPTQHWGFGLNVYGMPAVPGPGDALNVFVYGHHLLADGKHAKRVTAVRGGLTFDVTPEVE